MSEAFNGSVDRGPESSWGQGASSGVALVAMFVITGIFGIAAYMLATASANSVSA